MQGTANMGNNKTKTAKMPAEESLRQRFSKQSFANIEPIVAERRRRDPAHRRASYKGQRARYHLRLPEPLVHDLAFISYLTGEAQNDFCQRTLSDAAEKCLTALKEELPSDHWKVLSETFEKQRRKS